MRFSWFGGFIVQFYEGAEGHLLKELGLIELHRGWRRRCEAEPTDKLRAMCDSRPDLDTLYPHLVELVSCFKYSEDVHQPAACRVAADAGGDDAGWPRSCCKDMISREFRVR